MADHTDRLAVRTAAQDATGATAEGCCGQGEAGCTEWVLGQVPASAGPAAQLPADMAHEMHSGTPGAPQAADRGWAGRGACSLGSCLWGSPLTGLGPLRMAAAGRAGRVRLFAACGTVLSCGLLSQEQELQERLHELRLYLQ